MGTYAELVCAVAGAAAESGADNLARPAGGTGAGQREESAVGDGRSHKRAASRLVARPEPRGGETAEVGMVAGVPARAQLASAAKVGGGGGGRGGREAGYS